MFDIIILGTFFYVLYKGYLFALDYLNKEEKKYNEILRKSEDEHDISDWGV